MLIPWEVSAFRHPCPALPRRLGVPCRWDIMGYDDGYPDDGIWRWDIMGYDDRISWDMIWCWAAVLSSASLGKHPSSLQGIDLGREAIRKLSGLLASGRQLFLELRPRVSRAARNVRNSMGWYIKWTPGTLTNTGVWKVKVQKNKLKGLTCTPQLLQNHPNWIRMVLNSKHVSSFKMFFAGGLKHTS